MAAKTRKTTAGKGGARAKAGAGAATAERSKDAQKQSFGKAAPKPAKTTAAARPAKPPKAATGEPSIASRVLRKAKETASSAVARAASAIGKDGRKA
jgi:hypothetical protein